jgi:plastocyanin
VDWLMKEFRDRVLIPTLIPLAAVAVIAVIVLNVSRVLIALEERSGPNTVTALATILSSGILFGFAWYSSRARESSAPSLTLLSVGGLLVLTAGYFGAEAIHETEEEERAHAAEQSAAAKPDLTVHAFDIGWREKELKIGPGKVRIEVDNTGSGPHTFVFDGLTGPKLSVPSGGAKDLGEYDVTPGSYTYYCDIPGHRQAGMEGKLVVDAAGPAPGSGGGGGGGGAPVAIEGADLKFTPKDVTAPAGPVAITLKNVGALQHNLVVDGHPEFKKLDVAPGGSATGTFDAKPGTYVLYCDVAGHRPAGMESKLTVS